MQPLDVAVYGPMKRAWREVLFKWKRELKIIHCPETQLAFQFNFWILLMRTLPIRS